MVKMREFEINMLKATLPFMQAVNNIHLLGS